MPTAPPTPQAREFLSLAEHLWGLNHDEIVRIAVEAWRRKSPVEQAALTTGLLSPVQVDIVGTLLRPEEIVPGYCLLSALGYGGMGVVYKARQERLDRIVAVKTVLVYHLTDPKTLVRFQQEAKVLARLQHPNIVQAFDYGQHEGRLYIVMEMVTGQNLDHWITARGRLTEFTAWSLARQAAAGLAHAAHHGVVHRDIKPANMLVLEAPEGMSLPPGVPLLKLADFGLAVFSSDADQRARLTSINTAVGSPPYMSPEQLGGEPLDFHSDIYSLGAAVVHMLTGRAPFEGKTLARMLADKQSDARAWLSESCPYITPGSAELLAWMMAPNPADRPGNYAALLAAIDRLDLSRLEEQATQAVATPLGSSIATDHLGIDTQINTPRPPTGPTRDLPASALPPADQKPEGSSWLNWKMAASAALLVGAIATASFYAVNRPSGPRGERVLKISASAVPLFSGRQLEGWRQIGGEWTTSRDEEGAVVASGANGATIRALPAWRHYRIEGECELRGAEAAEVHFGFTQGGERYILRITATSEGRSAQLGKRRGTGAFEPLNEPHRLAPKTTAFHAIEIERQLQDWWLFVDGQPIGTLPVESALETPQIQLVAEGGTVWFASLIGAELGAR